MEMLAEDPHDATDDVERPIVEAAEPNDTDQRAAQEPLVADPGAPSGLRLALSSVGAFVLIVAIGGLVGVLIGPQDSEDVDTAAEVLVEQAPAAIAAALPATELPATTVATTAAPTTAAPTTAAPEPEAETIVLTADDVQVNEPVIVVQGVTELNLPIAGDSDDADPEAVDGTSTTATNGSSVVFLEMPKAVYDRFTLEVGDSFAINIAANDKIGGIFDSAELTGLGELAPGFTLNADGTLSGIARECGTWQAQYQLNSTNPAIGTSWIEITVGGCANT